MFEVKIYGEIVPFQDTWIEENGYFNLTLLNNQLDRANGQPILARINSFGGDVEEGFAIYQALRRYATENKVEVVTRCDGRCASIATVIFLAGDKRIVNEFISPFVHNAWTYAIGDAKTLMRLSSDLEKVNQQIAQHYANHTDLSIEEASNLMDEETSISPEECLRIRFATEIEKVDRPKALQRFSKPINNNKMSNPKKKSILAKIKSILDGQGIVNLEIFTDNQEVLDFYELGDGDVPKVGDKANFNDQPAEGTYKLADGVTQYKFEAGILQEIMEEDPGSSDNSEKDKEIENLKKEIETLKSKNGSLEVEVSNSKKQISSLKNLTSKYQALLDEEDDKSGDPDKGKKKEDPSKKFSNFKLVK
ncbi:MAG: ATP-dependent Clp protease proteolytic subunit [Fusobacteriaceae bacterium]